MSNGLVTPKAGAGGQVSIIPNINVTNRALPARVERSVLNATFQLDARQTRARALAVHSPNAAR